MAASRFRAGASSATGRAPRVAGHGQDGWDEGLLDCVVFVPWCHGRGPNDRLAQVKGHPQAYVVAFVAEAAANGKLACQQLFQVARAQAGEANLGRSAPKACHGYPSIQVMEPWIGSQHRGEKYKGKRTGSKRIRAWRIFLFLRDPEGREESSFEKKVFVPVDLDVVERSLR